MHSLGTNTFFHQSCYRLVTASNLIGSLVRLPDNHLHIAESEQVLRNEDKFQELIDLYHSKGQHRKGTYSVVCEDVMV